MLRSMNNNSDALDPTVLQRVITKARPLDYLSFLACESLDVFQYPLYWCCEGDIYLALPYLAPRLAVQLVFVVEVHVTWGYSSHLSVLRRWQR